MNVQQHRPDRGYAVRGNVYSFGMPWEQIIQNMEKVIDAEDVSYLPHSPKTLASVVLFSLRVGELVDLNKWMPQAKLRAHVVLKLLYALVDSKYKFGRCDLDPADLKRRFEESVNKLYPDTEQHLPEDERDGVVPEEVAKAMREAQTKWPSASDSGVKQKHATPVDQKQDISVVLEEVRPFSTFGDRES